MTKISRRNCLKAVSLTIAAATVSSKFGMPAIAQESPIVLRHLPQAQLSVF